ncbi:hypothetical protein ABQF34_29975 [Mycolicibacterium boenickei]
MEGRKAIAKAGNTSFDVGNVAVSLGNDSQAISSASPASATPR